MSLLKISSSCGNLMLRVSGSTRKMLDPVTLNAIYLLIWSVYEIYLCNDPFSAVSGSARKTLEPTNLSAIYLSMINVMSLRNTFMQWSIYCFIWKCSRKILEPTSLMLNAIKLWNIFVHWFIYCFIWKCSWNFGAHESQCNLSSDVECGQATNYIYAMIHLPLYLEVLVKF